MSRTKDRPLAIDVAKGFTITSEEVLSDYRLAYRSRIASIIGRREVLTGKAKFGIFGDGKEVAQLAMAKAFQPGDWRSGYYRDQTFMLAAEILTLREFFGQLYADTDIANDPASAGRQMGSHFASRLLDERGRFLPQTDKKLTTADLSPTAGQMVRLVGLAYASKLYRENPALKDDSEGFSRDGNEVAFGTIGNASTSEGPFWETINAAGVLQVPLVVSVWDDGYGISVPNEKQTTKSSISKVLAGFQANDDGPGYDIYTVPGWDYEALCSTYIAAVAKTRSDHVPALIHVTEMTQPQGHSTSGSHERYKSKERLAWEDEHDCLKKMRAWIVSKGFADEEQLTAWEKQDKAEVESDRKAAWEAYLAPIKQEQAEVLSLLEPLNQEADIGLIYSELEHPTELNRKLIHTAMQRALLHTRGSDSPERRALAERFAEYHEQNMDRYNSYLYTGGDESALKVASKPPVYSDSSEVVDGRLVLTRCFDHHFKKDARIFVIGEDVGKLGDVNLVFEGLNEKYGDLRVTDTGIREATIFGQGLGSALRGLRPIVDIQYLDYLMYALQPMSDDLASLHYRTAGGQKAPVIIRTKGHRLQGIWHTGSPMGMILSACRGIYLCVPRNMTQAAGMYNTLLRSDSTAIVVEVLNAYRLKEKVPDNVGTFTVALGEPEIVRAGADVTVVTYGACVRVALDAAHELEAAGIDVEVVDVQTLNPFDVKGTISESISKTNAVVFLDEDVPGGASAYMMQKVLEEQGAWQWLDTGPRTLAASENRSAYATDGEYFTKPNVQDVVSCIYEIMSERSPAAFPPLL